jgi:hypothetical protein
VIYIGTTGLTGRHFAGVPMKKLFPRIPLGPSLTYASMNTRNIRLKVISNATNLHSGDTKTFNPVRMPETNTSSEQDRLFRGKLINNRIQICFGKVGWSHGRICMGFV